jgi:photosystem II stability/assembly factor-like uncharacterized protein
MEAAMANFVYAGAAPWIAANRAARTGGLFRLDPASGRWDKLMAGLPDNVEVRAIAMAPGNPRVLYAGTQHGPYRSSDAGDSWHPLALPSNETIVWSVLVADETTLYVGTQGTTIYRSRDGGAHWTELTAPEPLGMVRMSFPCRVIRLALDPTAPQQLYAALEVGGVLKSRDGGDSWSDGNAALLDFTKEPRYRSRIVSDSETEGMMDSHALALSAAAPGTVFLANRMGLFKSEDGGERWQDMAVGRFSPLTYARDIKVSRHDPRRIYAALSVAAVSDEGSLYVSDDLGASWRRFDHGLAMKSTLMIIAESPVTPDRVWCATRRGQVFGTADGGKSWREYQLPDGVEGVYALAAV